MLVKAIQRTTMLDNKAEGVMVIGMLTINKIGVGN